MDGKGIGAAAVGRLDPATRRIKNDQVFDTCLAHQKHWQRMLLPTGKNDCGRLAILRKNSIDDRFRRPKTCDDCGIV